MFWLQEELLIKKKKKKKLHLKSFVTTFTGGDESIYGCVYGFIVWPASWIACTSDIMAGYRPEHKRTPEVIPAWNASGCWWRPALPATPLKLTVERKKGHVGLHSKCTAEARTGSVSSRSLGECEADAGPAERIRSRQCFPADVTSDDTPGHV